MKPAKILVVEDKLVTAQSIVSVLQKAGYIISGQAASGEDALVSVEKETPDVILMDINLDGNLDGIQTAEKIREKLSLPIIYLTDLSDRETLSRAKHTRPAAYLLKPFRKEDLLNAIEIAFFNMSEERDAAPGEEFTPQETVFMFKDRFFIKESEVMFRINISEVLWIEADRAYCKIKTTKKEYTQAYSMKMFSEKFSHPLLVRVQRSYIVNIDKITGIKGNQLLIGEAGNAEIPVSAPYKANLQNLFPIV